MFKIFSVFLFLIVSMHGFSQDKAALINKMMQDAADDGYFNGVIAVAENDKLVYARGFGCADAENKMPNDLNTLFNLCSISKQFTAMAVIMLRSENKLSLDDELTKYFPELPYKGIAVRHMLSHTSGLPDYMLLAMQYWPAGNEYANKEAIELLATHKPAILFNAGEKFQYCNTGYMLLASIVEKVSGKPFSVFLKERIFDPLGMSSTFVCTKDNKESDKKNCAGDMFSTGTIF